MLLNEGRALGGDKGRLIADQASAMQKQVEHYLQRARVAAQRDSVVYRTPVAPLLQRMVRVMQKLRPGTSAHRFAAGRRRSSFAGEREDLEEIARQSARKRDEMGKRTVAVTRRGRLPAGKAPASLF